MTYSPVLVTGANGKLGRELNRVGIPSADIITSSNSRIIEAASYLDVTNRESVELVVDEVRPRVIVHLAAVVGCPCEEDPTRARDVNVRGTQNVAFAALNSGVEKIVFVSTAAVYGDARRRPLSEHDTPAPASTYAATKFDAERVLDGYSESIAVDVLRVFNVYGPGFPESLVNRLLATSGAKSIQLMGLDGFVRDYVHIDDVARAIALAAQSRSSGFRVFNVGSGIPRSNRNLVESLLLAGESAVEIGPEIESYSWADVTAIKRELGWEIREPWPPEKPWPQFS